MNPPANRPSESPPPPHPSAETAPERPGPIPPPSHPRQYRAIGLIEGTYQRSEEQVTQGTLVAADGTAIDAVLLGRVISLVKKHLDLEKPHLWVVYPRTRQADGQLHVQIVGVWEPETLSQTQSSPEIAPQTLADVRHGFFSIRGEVIYASQEQETVIVKIRQSPKRESEKPKFFKLKLKGSLPDRPVSRFWDLQVQLQGSSLIVEGAVDLGPMAKRPFGKGRGKKLPFKGRKPGFPSPGRPIPPGPPGEKRPSPQRRRPLPKPTRGDSQK